MLPFIHITTVPFLGNPVLYSLSRLLVTLPPKPFLV